MTYAIFKNIFFIISFLLFLTTYSLSEINSKAWSTECNEDKTACLTMIKSEIKNKDNKMQTVATAYIQIGSSKKKKMDLINEDDQTYKLSEKNTDVPVLFVKLPFNADLRKKPSITIDGKKIGNLNFTHCTPTQGCVTNSAILNNTIDLFKKGKTMAVFMSIYGSANIMKIEFPLKNFSKSYTQIIKK